MSGCSGSRLNSGRLRREPGLPAPPRQHLGEGGQQQHRGGDPALGGHRLQRRPPLGRQDLLVAGEVRPPDGLGLAGQRQLRRAGPARRPARCQYRRRPLVARGIAQRPLGQHVVAEGHSERRQLGVRVGVEQASARARQVGAGGVQDQARRCSRAAGPRRPAASPRTRTAASGRRRAARATSARGSRPAGARPPRPVQPAQVVAGHPIRRHLGQHPLGAVGGEHRAQHVVPLDQPVQRPAEPVRRRSRPAGSPVAVRADPAELDGGSRGPTQYACWISVRPNGW